MLLPKIILDERKTQRMLKNDSASILEKLNIKKTYVTHKDKKIHIPLSKQQSLCLSLITKGKSAKEIARQLSLSPRTIEYYLRLLREKLGCRTSKELIRFYSHQL